MSITMSMLLVLQDDPTIWEPKIILYFRTIKDHGLRNIIFGSGTGHEV